MAKSDVYGYEAIAADLLKRIEEGEWQLGEALPPLSDLERSYPRSRMTVYKGLKRLEDLGYISMERGRGTFVRRARSPKRIAILTGAGLFRFSYVPFAFQAFQHAHAYFVRAGMDAQLYVEDPLNETGLPTGLHDELERKKIAGILAVDARFPTRYMLTDDWQRMAIPVVNLGARAAPYTVYIDRNAFLERAVALAAREGRARLGLVERAEHMGDDAGGFSRACSTHKVAVVRPPGDMPPGELSYEEYGFELLQRLWREKTRPDAVIVPDDVIAKGVVQAALALRLAVPDELLIIAMTNRGAPFFYPVPIVCFEVDVESLVAKASRMLVEMISGAAPKPSAVLMAPLFPRVVGAEAPQASATARQGAASR